MMLMLMMMMILRSWTRFMRPTTCCMILYSLLFLLPSLLHIDAIPILEPVAIPHPNPNALPFITIAERKRPFSLDDNHTHHRRAVNADIPLYQQSLPDYNIISRNPSAGNLNADQLNQIAMSFIKNSTGVDNIIITSS